MPRQRHHGPNGSSQNSIRLNMPSLRVLKVQDYVRTRSGSTRLHDGRWYDRKINWMLFLKMHINGRIRTRQRRCNIPLRRRVPLHLHMFMPMLRNGLHLLNLRLHATFLILTSRRHRPWRLRLHFQRGAIRTDRHDLRPRLLGLLRRDAMPRLLNHRRSYGTLRVNFRRYGRLTLSPMR